MNIEDIRFVQARDGSYVDLQIKVNSTWEMVRSEKEETAPAPCDCTVAVGDGERTEEEVTLSSAVECATSAARRFEQWCKNPMASKIVIEGRKGFILRNHLNADYDCFTYCPRCGRKIDWDGIFA